MSLDVVMDASIEHIQAMVVTAWAIHFIPYAVFQASQSISAKGRKVIFRFFKCISSGKQINLSVLKEDMHCEVSGKEYIYCLKGLQNWVSEMAVMASNSFALRPLNQLNARIFPGS